MSILEGEKYRMAPTVVNQNNPQGGLNNAPQPKKQAQLGFSQGKLEPRPRLARRSSARTRQDRARREPARRTMEVRVILAWGSWKWTRSLPPPQGEAASLQHVDGQKLTLGRTKGGASQIHREVIERRRKPQVTRVSKALSREPDSPVSSAR